MSRAIQVRVSESVVRTVHVEDGVQAQLEVLPILAPERMGALLAAELVGIGFALDADGTRATRIDADGLAIEIDTRAATIAVRLGAATDVDETIAREARVEEERAARATAQLRAGARAELEARATAAAEALRQEVTARLAAKLGALRTELDGAIGRATIAALTERAAQLGAIESVVSDAAGNVTIKVKL